MLTCCPVGVRPPCVWPRCSLPSFLSFALQLAVDVQVTVGSLLPYGAQPSRWGHSCRVEAAVVLDRNEGLVCFSFPSGLILRVGITLWVDTAFDLILDRNVVFSVSLFEVVQDHHCGLPNSGVELEVASVPVCPGALIFCHSTTYTQLEVSLLLGPLSFPDGL